MQKQNKSKQNKTTKCENRIGKPNDFVAARYYPCVSISFACTYLSRYNFNTTSS